jgi:Apea-like HEPN
LSAFAFEGVTDHFFFASFDIQRQMSWNGYMTIEFHEQAATRFNILAQELLTKARQFPPAQQRPNTDTSLYPVTNLTEADIIGSIEWKQRSVNGLGEETGRYWESSSVRVGYEDHGYAAVKDLAKRLAQTKPLQNRVSLEFLMDQLFTWLSETLESKRRDGFMEFIAHKATEAIKAHEYWIPVYRTYSSREFAIGNVQFKTFSPAMLERWYSRIPEEERRRAPEATMALVRQRSLLQGSLAAVVVIEAEPRKAAEAAQSAADEAVAMLRFLSEVNWTCRITSHCLPVGKENTRTTMDIQVENGQIRTIGKRVIEQGPSGWNVDEARSTPLTSGVLELLQELASKRSDTELRTDLYGALQLHARASIATEVAHKLVFVVAAAESIFLRNASEPIQKNLGERLAFLLGQNVEERKAVIKNVDDFYAIRSGLIHHGKEVEDHQKDIVDAFFVNVWVSFMTLMRSGDRWKTRNDMFVALEERKLA